MFTALIILHVLVSFLIIALVLLQAGKGADIGSAFGGAGSQAVFGSMGTPTLLGKATTVVAVVFMVTSFSLALMAQKRGAGTIMPMTGPAPVTEPAPVAEPPAASPAAPAPPAGPRP